LGDGAFRLIKAGPSKWNDSSTGTPSKSVPAHCGFGHRDPAWGNRIVPKDLGSVGAIVL